MFIILVNYFRISIAVILLLVLITVGCSNTGKITSLSDDKTSSANYNSNTNNSNNPICILSTTAELSSARFVLWVADPFTRWPCGRFDLFEALLSWDAEYRLAFMAWVSAPWWE
ncbi:MAG: hypothetical protein JW841_03260 [Deltaproteobacteria bacterium]|nr:hypothetical protein [Deltaproteobacteria bacterium]